MESSHSHHSKYNIYNEMKDASNVDCGKEIFAKPFVFIKGLFGICLFCWNWKLFAESIVNKGKN